MFFEKIVTHMPRVVRFCLFVMTMVLSLVARGQSKTDLTKKIENNIRKYAIPKTSLSMAIGREVDGQVEIIYSLNDKQKFMPASLTKMVTGAAALELLTNDFQQSTQIWLSRKINGATYEGDIYLVGNGDPGFVSENLWFLVNEFVRTGIKEIKGNIVVDDSRFDSIRFDPGRDPQRVNRAYDAPIGAMSFNWNSVNVFIRPGSKVGAKPILFADPESAYIQIDNRVKTIKGSSVRVGVQRVEKKNGDLIRVKGAIGINAPETVKYTSISKPEIWSGYQLLAFFERRSIRVKGSVQKGSVPIDASMVAEYKGKQLAESVRDMLKYSNNFVAEMLTKNIAAKMKGPPGKMDAGIEAISQYLVSRGFQRSHFMISSPSGLSRKNQLRSADLLSLLLDLKSDFKVFPEFVSALPIMGVDGTLKSRLNDDDIKNRIRAKTGLLTGVVGLAGYASPKSRSPLAFVFIFNGKGGLEVQAKAMFDTLLSDLVRN
ncbi:MAG: D-alanyl-D-alanine carboxypeptidase/D-alanyl-D-alanine-endopeptidase [Bdellovibrionales bacterium]|nr:D-alanyl-D-alanine carboxypeptidase/D-alanyl-D-alanine-endopeptidase [Bdellovibrionales bacterium]